MNFLLSLLISLSFSYIPHSHFILEKVGQKHGKGSYRILQESIFQSGKERIVVQETWIVDDGVNMYLEAKGPGVHYTAKYDFQQKVTKNKNESTKYTKQSPEFFEGFFYLKEAKDLARSIYRSKILGQNILAPQKRFYHLSQVEYKGQSFLRLTKNSGSVAYTFSEPPAKDETSLKAALWVEQDEFDIKKIRFPHQVDIVAEKYEAFSKGLYLPKERIISWEQNQTPIQLLKVSTVSLSKSDKSLLNLKSSDGLKPNQFANSPLHNQVKEFYSRFR